MDLALSPEQQEVRTLAREFAEREVKPRAEAIDHNSEFPRDLVDKAAKLGLLGVLVPDAYGGAGLDHVAFGCESRAELEKWAGRLDELGVARGEIKDASYGSGLSFRDPDGIALEFFAPPG